MKGALLIAALLALAACERPHHADGPHMGSDTHQQPSNYMPGIHMSGHANVGVYRRF